MQQRLHRSPAHLLWLLAVVGVVAALLAERLLDPVCELSQGSSVFGRASYTLLGQTCTYTVDGTTFAQHPSLLRAVVVGLLLAWLLSLLMLERRRAA